MRTEQVRKNTLKIADFIDKSPIIVDDDNPFRERLTRAMEKKGFQVTQAESVKQGVVEVKLRASSEAAIIATSSLGEYVQGVLAD